MKKLKVFSMLIACLPLMALGLTLASCENPADSTPTNYKVNFNINGGSGTAPGPITVQDGSSITLPGGSGLSRDG